VAKDFVLVGYDAASLGKGLQIFFEEHTVLIFKGLEVTILWDCEEENTVFFFLETSKTYCPVTRCLKLEERSPHDDKILLFKNLHCLLELA
jgi:uncharacterized OsmC-like protein